MKTFLTDIYTIPNGSPLEVEFICKLRTVDVYKRQSSIAYIHSIEDILGMVVVTKDKIIEITPSYVSKDSLVFSVIMSLENIESLEYIAISTTSTTSLNIPLELPYV